MASEKNKAVIEKPDWTIEELYRKAWQIVKNNKMLWVFGAAIGAGASFFNNYNSNIEFDKSNLEKLPQPLENNLRQIQEFVGTIVPQLIPTVPQYLWILLGLEVLFIILLGIVISLIYKSWATGTLLENVDRCIKGGKATIREASEKAFTVLKPLLWLEIISGIPAILLLIITLITLVSFVMAGSGQSSGALMALPFTGLLLIFVYLPIYFCVWIIMTGILIWATRQVVTEDKPAKEALRSGYNIVKKKFWTMLLLGLVNNILVAIVIGIPIVILIGIIIGGFFAYQSIQSLGIGIFIIGGLLLFTLIIAGTVVGGILAAFKASIWSLAYNNIKGKYTPSLSIDKSIIPNEALNRK